MRISDTLTGKKEEFTPLSDEVRMYVCGVTPYSACHLGHAMSFIIFDTIRRYLEFRGYPVKYVQNFTDVDDKIIARANELGVTAREMAGEYIQRYFEDMDALNVKRADVYPWATEEIPKMIEVIRGLIDKGYAYETGGDVYFRVKSDPDYGKLSHRNLDEMMAGARIEVDEAKQHPLDFALWKATKPGEPYWDSPWGNGRPGWHIECSAMSLRYLGETLDIHGGGQDLIFPHHENEIAQSECFTGVKPFVRHWIHNGLMQLGEDKMSKSTGTLVTITDALQKYSADAIRLWVLSSHYRSPLVYSEESLEAAERGVERMRRVAHIEAHRGNPASIDAEGSRQLFIEAMDDDFGSPQASAVLFDLAREINRAHDQGEDVSDAQHILVELAAVLGLTLKEPAAVLPLQDIEALAAKYGFTPDASAQGDQRATVCIQALIDKRTESRKARDFGLADAIRADLVAIGVNLEDTPQGTVWKYKKP